MIAGLVLFGCTQTETPTSPPPPDVPFAGCATTDWPDALVVRKAQAIVADDADWVAGCLTAARAAGHDIGSQLLEDAVTGPTPHPTVVARLLTQGVAPEPVHLWAAATANQATLISQLIEAGADPNATIEGRSVLHHVAALGDRATLEALLRAGADPDASARLSDKDGGIKDVTARELIEANPAARDLL